MKKTTTSVCFAATLLILLASPASQAALIAYWNFNGLTASTNNGSSYPPTAGEGTLELSGWTSTATTGVTSFAGTTSNAIPPDPAGQSLTLQGGIAGAPTANNGASLLITVDMRNRQDLVLSFASQGTATGFIDNQVAWSTDGISFTDFGNPYSPASSFGIQTFDFSAIDGLENLETAYLRIVFDGATAATGNNRIDNVKVNAIPEPAPVLLGAFGLLAILRRKREC